MELRLALVGIVARDMGASLAFYRGLGLGIPDGAEEEPHVEATTSSGLRVAWDTAELIRQIDPEWTEPSDGHRVALAFCARALPVSTPNMKNSRRSATGTRSHGMRPGDSATPA